MNEILGHKFDAGKCVYCQASEKAVQSFNTPCQKAALKDKIIKEEDISQIETQKEKQPTSSPRPPNNLAIRIAIIGGFICACCWIILRIPVWHCEAEEKKISQDYNEVLKKLDEAKKAEEQLFLKRIAEQEKARIKIKGLSIGMSMDDAYNTLKDTLAGTKWQPYRTISKNTDGKDTLIIIRIKNTPTTQILAMGEATFKDCPAELSLQEMSCFVREAFQDMSLNGCGLVLGSSDTGIEMIALGSRVIGDVFDANDLSARQFMRQFVDSYNIPKMTLSEDAQYWEYTNAENVNIKILTERKTLMIGKVKSKKDREKSFD